MHETLDVVRGERLLEVLESRLRDLPGEAACLGYRVTAVGVGANPHVEAVLFADGMHEPDVTVDVGANLHLYGAVARRAKFRHALKRHLDRFDAERTSNRHLRRHGTAEKDVRGKAGALPLQIE